MMKFALIACTSLIFSSLPIQASDTSEQIILEGAAAKAIFYALPTEIVDTRDDNGIVTLLRYGPGIKCQHTVSSFFRDEAYHCTVMHLPETNQVGQAK